MSCRAVGSALAVAAMVLSGSEAKAQEWFPAFEFHLDGAYAASGHPRFNWLFDFGGDLDVLQAGRVRAVFVANYEAVAGEQFRRFDVNQGNYLLEGALLWRVRGVELGPVWHHVSRHLSDRTKRFPVDWNMIALRVADRATHGALATSWRADARRTVASAFVDYEWEVEAAGDLGYALSSRYSITGSAGWRVVGVDGSRGRGTQVEGRVDAGVRMRGRAASAELFIGVERRLDPYPVEFGTASWFLAGLRVGSVP